MIGWLQGVLRDRRPPFLLVDVGGVGYELQAPMTTFYELPPAGQEVTLHTHQVVRDDAHQLYAFIAKRDRDVFRLLLKVNGVGAKLALTILSGMDTTSFGRCVALGDALSLAKLPGIGKKTAERLIIDLRDRFDSPEFAEGGTAAARPASTGRREGASSEAINALVALGLKVNEATKRVDAVNRDDLECEELVRRALQTMVR